MRVCACVCVRVCVCVHARVCVCVCSSYHAAGAGVLQLLEAVCGGLESRRHALLHQLQERDQHHSGTVSPNKTDPVSHKRADQPLSSQGALTQLIQYYHGFHKVLSQPTFRSLAVRSELINLHHLMVEVKKHKPNF